MVSRSLLLALALAGGLGAPGARADVTFVWHTLSATLDGQPTNLTASGEITLTDAGFAAGFGEVTSTPFFGPPSSVMQTLDGIASASFQMFGGPPYATGQTAGDLTLVNFSALVRGQDLLVLPDNSHGGFMVDVDDGAAYFGTMGTGDEFTVSYGTDASPSPCFGTQYLPGSHCVVTGVFEDPVPEPGTLPISLSALGLFLLIRKHHDRRLRA